MGLVRGLFGKLDKVPGKKALGFRPSVLRLFLIGFGTVATARTATWDQALPSQASLVVLVAVAEKEVGATEVLRIDDEFCLRAGDFAQFTGIEMTPSDAGIAVVTPLGATTIPNAEIRRIEEEPYLCTEVLGKRLATVLSFEPATVTLRLDVPWSLVAPVPAKAALVPEIRAPQWGLGTVHVDVNGVVEEDSSSYTGNAWATGRALGGEWRVLAQTTTSGKPELREALWVTRKETWFTFLGRNYVQLAPILSGFDMVGAGFGWSNRRLPATGAWGSLTGFSSTATRSFRGTAPPGSFVKLRINGAVVATQQVGLTGRFEFWEVPVAGGRGSVNVEVEIYDRHNLLTPLEVRRFLTPTSWLLLPEDCVEVVGGAGMGGLWGRDLWGGDALLRETVAYSAVRWGLRENLTGEGVVQTVGNRWHAGVGLAWQASPGVFTALTLAEARNKIGWNWEANAQKGALSLFVRALEQPETFHLRPVGGMRRDYSLELRYNPTKWLEVGLWGRQWDLGADHSRWVRPTAVVSLGSLLFLRVVPDQWGDFIVTGTSQPHPRLRLSASYFHSQVYDALWELPTKRPWDLRGTFECGGQGANRLTVSLGNRAPSFRVPRFRVGIMGSGGYWAPYGEVAAPVWSGFWFRAQYLGIPSRVQRGTKPSGRFFLSLTADFGYSMGRFVATDSTTLRRELGGVAGRLLLAKKSPGTSLAGARVQLLGFGGTTTAADGSFFMGNVPPGVYEVELDPERLPLELVPLQRRFVVEVAAGTITRVDFPLRQLFGLAGQVRTPDGRGVPGVLVELRQGGKLIASQEVDSFGYFRFDQLESGSYLLAAFSGEHKLGERTVVVEDFLFEQDVVVSAPQ